MCNHHQNQLQNNEWQFLKNWFSLIELVSVTSRLLYSAGDCGQPCLLPDFSGMSDFPPLNRIFTNCFW